MPAAATAAAAVRLTKPVFRLPVLSHAQPGIEDQLNNTPSISIYARSRLLEAGEVTLHPLDLTSVAPFCQLLLRVGGVLLLVGQKV